MRAEITLSLSAHGCSPRTLQYYSVAEKNFFPIIKITFLMHINVQNIMNFTDLINNNNYC